MAEPKEVTATKEDVVADADLAKAWDATEVVEETTKKEEKEVEAKTGEKPTDDGPVYQRPEKNGRAEGLCRPLPLQGHKSQAGTKPPQADGEDGKKHVHPRRGQLTHLLPLSQGQPLRTRSHAAPRSQKSLPPA